MQQEQSVCPAYQGLRSAGTLCFFLEIRSRWKCT